MDSLNITSRVFRILILLYITCYKKDHSFSITSVSYNEVTAVNMSGDSNHQQVSTLARELLSLLDKGQRSSCSKGGSHVHGEQLMESAEQQRHVSLCCVELYTPLK